MSKHLRSLIEDTFEALEESRRPLEALDELTEAEKPLVGKKHVETDLSKIVKELGMKAGVLGNENLNGFDAQIPEQPKPVCMLSLLRMVREALEEPQHKPGKMPDSPEPEWLSKAKKGDPKKNKLPANAIPEPRKTYKSDAADEHEHGSLGFTGR